MDGYTYICKYIGLHTRMYCVKIASRTFVKDVELLSFLKVNKHYIIYSQTGGMNQRQKVGIFAYYFHF